MFFLNLISHFWTSYEIEDYMLECVVSVLNTSFYWWKCGRKTLWLILHYQAISGDTKEGQKCFSNTHILVAAQPPKALRAGPDLYRDSFTFNTHDFQQCHVSTVEKCNSELWLPSTAQMLFYVDLFVLMFAFDLLQPNDCITYHQVS